MRRISSPYFFANPMNRFKTVSHNKVSVRGPVLNKKIFKFFFNSKEEVEHLLIIDKKTGKVYIAVEEKEDKSIDK